MLQKAKTIIDALSVGSDGLDFNPSAEAGPGAMSTKLSGNVRLRHRKTPSGTRLEMVVAYSRKGLASDGMDLVKQADSPEFINRTGVYLASKLRSYAADAIVPAPSRSPAAKMLANRIASILGIPVIDCFFKEGSVSQTWVGSRKEKAATILSVKDAPLLNGTVIVVDDFITSGATMSVAADLLLRLPDVKTVVGTAIAAA